MDGRVTARLVPAGKGEDKALVMELSTYGEGIVRVKVLEETAPHNRFEVPHVVVNEFEGKRMRIGRIGRREGASIVSLSSEHNVIIQHKPFQAYALIAKVCK